MVVHGPREDELYSWPSYRRGSICNTFRRASRARHTVAPHQACSECAHTICDCSVDQKVTIVENTSQKHRLYKQHGLQRASFGQLTKVHGGLASNIPVIFCRHIYIIKLLK